MSIASESLRCASELRFRSASNTRARPITVSPWTFFKSELTVSAMPVPIQSSVGSRVMFANVITATELSTRAGAAAEIRDDRRGVTSRCALSDLQVVVDLARRLVTEFGRLLERA